MELVATRTEGSNSQYYIVVDQLCCCYWIISDQILFKYVSLLQHFYPSLLPV